MLFPTGQKTRFTTLLPKYFLFTIPQCILGLLRVDSCKCCDLLPHLVEEANSKMRFII